jgi:hypothetical protein
MITTARALAIVGAVLLGVGPTVADAKPTEEAQRLMKRNKAERYRAEATGTSVRAGGARVHVAAPIEVVRDVITDFGRYPQHISKFEKAKVVGKSGKNTDVYMQVRVLNGLGKVWAVVRFEPPKTLPNGEATMVGRMVKGNVDRFDASVRLTKIDAENTQLNLELLLLPTIPLPGSLITGELMYAADQAATGLRNWSEEIAKQN